MNTIVLSTAGSLNLHLGEVLAEARIEAKAGSFLARASEYQLAIVHQQSVGNALDTILDSLVTSGCKHIGVASDYPQLEEFLRLSQWPIRAYFHAYMAAPHYRQIPQALELGQGWYMPGLLNDLIGLARQTLEPVPNRIILAKLSDRERQVATLVSQGCSNANIAEQCYITERTVKSHLSNIFRKLGVSDRVSLAIAVNQR
jgi:DNA-binding NarL/FixJ family response regulator